MSASVVTSSGEEGSPGAADKEFPGDLSPAALGTLGGNRVAPGLAGTVVEACGLRRGPATISRNKYSSELAEPVPELGRLKVPASGLIRLPAPARQAAKPMERLNKVTGAAADADALTSLTAEGHAFEKN
ncbi:hypothetical protein CYMTET_30310 [Cymbomonas tetramitiformis]|uniref:Uncharacterized protein n=1 Tax=Cymbomonas tetramitiformis TaxID=36881 RepID=A0AAE0KU99_9CHLO|nr:hypothetical protein CYMTET_30310 [Cymbomonas tetramitiformis]